MSTASRAARAPSSSGVSLRGAALAVLYLAGFAALAAIASRGADFYRTPLLERAHHDGYWQWKAGGSISHALGVTGTTMMLTMLLYSVRKRVGLLRHAGPLRLWLDGHIFLGVFGPLLVVLHSTFKVQGLVALSFWSMIVVAASGVLGRFLYLQIPRTRAGEEIALAEIEAQDRELSDSLRTRFGLDEARLAELDGLVAVPPRTGLAGGLWHLVAGDLRLRSALRAFARRCRSVPRPVFAEFERVVLQKARTRRRIVLWDRAHELFHYWHVLHKPFAVVMYLFMIVHVAVAAVTGYAWGARP